ncbi:unnamed protein product [Leptosia nina]|uniref:Uncharacterized protein n=1 Tax=Leptosia nina TaxID=320188 RepID=A0AAV1JEF0_9NEOP
MIKIFLILAALALCEGVTYSSFWAPLFNPRILNYRVDLDYNPDAGKLFREEYTQKYGYRGAQLIEDLGNGKGPSDSREQKSYGDVRFYYTYPGANLDQR